MDSKLDEGIQYEVSNGNNVIASEQSNDQRIKFEDWGFQVDRLFEVAYRFYKRNEGKAFNPSFDVRNQMNALMLQARYGNLDSSKLPDLGTLDLVGKRRRQEWSQLHGMSKTEAMSKFICNMDDICPLFKAHAEAVKLSTSALQSDYRSSSADARSNIAIPESAEGEQLQTIYNSLCRQTYDQFKNYAEQQLPNDIFKQKSLISTLQAQYYRQYVSQMHPELSSKLQQTHSDSNSLSSNSDTVSTSRTSPVRSEKHSSVGDDSRVSCSDVMEVVAPDQKQDPSVNANDLAANLNEAKIMENDTSNRVDSTVEQPTDETSPVLSDISSEIHSSTQSSNNIQVSLNSPTDLPRNGNVETSNEKSSNYQETPTRSYARVDPSNIGSFESFPKPKPLTRPHLSQKVCPENPHIVSSPMSSKLQESQPDKLQTPSQASPAIKSSDKLEPPHLDLPPLSEMITQTEPAAEEPSIQIVQSSNPPLYQEEQQYQAQHSSPYIDINHQHDTINEDWPGSSTTNHVSINDRQTNRHPPEPWSRASSSGSGSPTQVNTIGYSPLEAATLWTKSGVREFRDSLVDDEHGGEYVVKQGSRLIIQVPTYPTGNYIYWEFATDAYDIGFGVDFIHEPVLEKPLAMQIFDDSDDDDDEDDIFDDEETYYAAARAQSHAGVDPELGLNQYIATNPTALNNIPANPLPNIPADDRRALCEQKRADKLEKLSRTISIVPIYRRDSHEDVIVGRHRYPGRGYYRLKFDNTYSVLRSKTLFFRVCFFT